MFYIVNYQLSQAVQNYLTVSFGVGNRKGIDNSSCLTGAVVQILYFSCEDKYVIHYLGVSSFLFAPCTSSSINCEYPLHYQNLLPWWRKGL